MGVCSQIRLGKIGNCFNLYRQVFYRARIAGLSVFRRAHSRLCSKRKRKKQAVLNIKNGETNDMTFYKKTILEI